MGEFSQRLENLSPAKRRLLDEVMRKASAQAEPIAVVGLGCRFPGANNIDAYWRIIREGRVGTGEIPASRWDVDELYDPSGQIPGRVSTRWGGFLEHIDQFDPLFFGISPREAEKMDPQHRLLLEVAWEALEHAAIAPDSLRGTAAGVFVGIGGVDYSRVPAKLGDYLEQVNEYGGTGNALSIAANRISYVLDLRGPSMAVDTACSSALVAVHLGVRSLRSREADLVLAGGVNAILTPETTVAFSKAKMLSPDGRCRPFDKAANGYVRAEGCGIIVLKRFDDAVNNGDNVLAVLRGSAINHDGRTSGITAPNPNAQKDAIRSALREAGMTADDISYIEAHGTGTPLGDPIEVQALTELFARRTTEQPPCYMGSVKANIGHSETAAGIAGLIKVVLMLRHGEIPRQAEFEELNPHISLDGSRLIVPREPIAWSGQEKPRRAGVSSYGFGGTNAHVVVEEAPSRPKTAAPGPDVERPLHVLALSGKSDVAVRELAARYRQHLEEHPGSAVPDVAHTANVGRAHSGHRAAVIAGSRDDFQQRLAALAEGTAAKGVHQARVRSPVRPKIAFLFTGQGSQYAGMGLALFEKHPVFREALLECEEILVEELERPLLSVMHGASGCESLLDETAYTQPALFSLEYALATLWRSWGIEPDVVLGHSVGEYTAACVAGALSLEEGLRLIARRARLMQDLPYGGQMAVVFAPLDRVRDALAGYEDSVDIAAVNGPENTVISGEGKAVQEVVTELDAEGVRCQPLKVSHAFHSPLMEPILEEFEVYASQFDYRPPNVPLISNLTGQVLDGGTMSAAYWTRHIRRSVCFAQSVDALAEFCPDAVLEIGPAATLLGMARRCPVKLDCLWLPSLRSGQDDWQTILDALGQLYVAGFRVDWTGFDRPWPRRRLALPTYPFQRTAHWLDMSQYIGYGTRGARQSPGLHPLLGNRVRKATPGALFESSISYRYPAFVAEHRLQGSPLYPAAGYVEQALAAAEKVLGEKDCVVEHLTIQQGMFVPEGESRTVQVSLSPAQQGRCTIEIHSAAEPRDGDEAKWSLHARASVRGGAASDDISSANSLDCESLHARSAAGITGEVFYREMAARGLNYGPRFQLLDDLRQTDAEAIAKVVIPKQVCDESGQYRVHPALLDACFQAMAGVVPRMPDGRAAQTTYVPAFVAEARVCGSPVEAKWVHAVRTEDPEGPSPDFVEGDVSLLDATGRVVVRLRGVRVQKLGRFGQDAAKADLRDWLYAMDWIRCDSTSDRVTADVRDLEGKRILVFADRGRVAHRLAQEISRRGGMCVLALPGSGFRSVPEARNGSSTAVEIDPLSLGDYERLLKAGPEVGGATFNQVIHLWSLDLKCADGADATKAGGRDSPSDAADIDLARRLGHGSALTLIRALARSRSGNTPALCIATQAAQQVVATDTVACWQSPMWGLGRVAALEHPELDCRLIDTDPRMDPAATAAVLIDELAGRTADKQVAFRDGARYAARLDRAAGALTPETEAAGSSKPRGDRFRLRLGRAGDFDGLYYEPLRRTAPGPGQVEIEVRAAGLNFSDVLKAMGLYPGITDAVVPLGIECAGRVCAVGESVDRFHVGDEVMGVAPYSFASHAVTAEYAIVHRPPNIAEEDACSIPVTFLTAYYALRKLADLRRGERVLIHAAAGGVGLAAIQIAQHLGAEVFATAGSDRKREYLQSLGVRHVMSSRTLDFADEVVRLTGGRGVDVVLNSLPGEAIDRSLSVLAAYGRFLEIGKTDIYQNRAIGLLPFQDNLSYFAIDLDRMLRQRGDAIRDLWAELIELFTQGVYRPLPVTVFEADQTVDAFRYMAQRKNIGKVVVSMEVESSAPAESGPVAGPIRADGSYLITGGLGALGMQLAEWLARSGAGEVVLLARRAPDEAARQAIARIVSLGTKVRVLQADVGDFGAVCRAVDTIAAEGKPLRGVFHAAGVLADGILYEMNLDQFDRAAQPKIAGGWNLHRATLGHPLDHFVLFSSVASLLGSPGQGNYAAGNAFLDGLAQYRRSRGLPAVAINWGPWGGTGMAAEEGKAEQIAARGMNLLPPHDALEILGRLLSAAPANIAVMDADWQKLLGKAQRNRPAVFERLAPSTATAASESAAEVDDGLRGSLASATAEQRQQLLRDCVAEELARVIGVGRDELDVQQPLSGLGLDSLMGMEVKIKLERRLGIELPMAGMFDNPTVASLAELADKTLATVGGLSGGAAADQLSADDGMTHITVSGEAAASPDRVSATSGPLLLPLQAEGHFSPLFCVHPAGGDVRCYLELARQLRGVQPVYALRARGLGEGESPHGSMETMAGDYLSAVRTVQPMGPYHLAGWSTGGVFAYEMARQLLAQGEAVAALWLFDTPTPAIFRDVDLGDDARFLFDLVNFSNWFAGTTMQVSYESLHRMDPQRRLERLLAEGKQHAVLPPGATTDQLRRILDVCRENVRLLMTYKPLPLSAPLYLFRPDDTEVLAEASGQSLDEDLGWEKTIGFSPHMIHVPGNHFSMMTGENVS
ncbi:MAG: SDR family NAD(P)-dependent oxidoreductase, partial [Planctomycetota bacterium]